MLAYHQHTNNYGPAGCRIDPGVLSAHRDAAKGTLKLQGTDVHSVLHHPMTVPMGWVDGRHIEGCGPAFVCIAMGPATGQG